MPIPLGILAVAGAGAGAAGSYELIETIETNAYTYTFTNLGSLTDYKHLQLRIVGRNENPNFAESWQGVGLKVNGVTSGYAWHRLRGNGSSVTSTNATSQTWMSIGFTPNNGFRTNEFGAIITDILDFSSTTKTKTIRSFYGFTGRHVAEGQNVQQVGLTSGLYNSTNAITSITVEPVDRGRPFRVSLYGIKG